jgi:HK97 family phage major capsid protein
MNLQELRAQTEVELDAAQMRQKKAKAEIQLILDTARQEGRSNLTDEETARSDKCFENIELAKTQESGIKDKLARVAQLEAEDREADKRAKDVTPGARTPERRTASVSVGREERTYHRGNDPTGTVFLRDVCRQYLYNDVGSNARLAQHMNEERVERAAYLERASDATSNFTGLTVPQYLTDMVAPAVANMKPFADLGTNPHQLPPAGMSVNISKITTATQAGLQPTGENNALLSQAASDTLLTIPVQTAGGWVNVSRQAIDRGTGIDDVLMQDLFKRYYTDLDNQLLNQTTTGLANIAQSTAATTGTTGPGVYSAIMGAASRAETTLLGFGQATHAVMHPRRWFWLASQMSSTWPMIAFQRPAVPFNQVGTATDGPYGSQVRGTLPNGLDVIVDANVSTTVSTNQDEIFVTSRDECHLWTDPNQPAFIRAEQPNVTSLGVLLVVYGYYAYTFNRYTNAQQVITSTNFTAPTF